MKWDEMTTLKTDVLIVGGGAVGMTLAIGLACQKKSVLLIDKKPKATPASRQARLARRDARVYALNLASLALLQEVGVQDFARRADYTDMQVWQGDGRGELIFDKPDHAEILGSMIEPSVLDEALMVRAESAEISPFLSVWHEAWLDEYVGMDVYGRGGQGGVRVLVHHEGKKTLIDAALLVGADGRSSMVRQLMGVDISWLDYQQSAICCAIKTDKPHANTARQAMLNTGTLALLPLADLLADDGGHWQSVVWTLPRATAKAYLALPPKQLAQKLAQASGFELGEVGEIESIASFDLSAQVAKSYTAPHALLIGDAAHGVHPLAGQGLNLGLADVRALLDLAVHRVLSDAQANAKLLRQYERARRANNALMMHSFSLINYAFAGGLFQQEPWRFIRSEAVNLTGKIRPLMAFFNKKAGGF